MSQFVSKWPCNSRVLSSRDKGHPIILGKGIGSPGSRHGLSSLLKPPATLGSAPHKYADMEVLAASTSPLPLLIVFLDEWRLSDQN